MTQSINLYQAEFQPRSRDWAVYFPWLFGAAGLLVVLACSAYLYGSTHRLQTSLEQQQAHYEQLEGEAEALRTQLAQRSSDPRIALEREELETQLETSRRLEALLSDEQQPGLARHSFVDMLVALAAQTQDDFWLTRISFADGGHHVQLQGLSRKRSAVADYLLALSEEPSFDGRSFNVLNVEPVNEGVGTKGQFAFLMGTQVWPKANPETGDSTTVSAPDYLDRFYRVDGPLSQSWGLGNAE